MADDLTLFCLVDGESTLNAFSVEIDPSKTVDGLKDRIRAKTPDTFTGVDAKDLILWKVSIKDDDDGDDDVTIVLDSVPGSEKKKLRATRELSDVFKETPPKKTIHIIVERPPQVQAPIFSNESRPGTPPSDEKWQELVVQIEDTFFAPDSNNYTSLVQFVKGGANVPTTGGSLGGLPFVLPRADRETNNPSLLFLNLPESPGTQDPPSTADRALEKLRGRAIPVLPLFGVSGCGKTRTAIEMLCMNWGFYFNGRSTDWVCFRTLGFEDLFDSLFTLFADTIYLQSIDITLMSSFVRVRFSKLRLRLLDLTFNTPSQGTNYKILLVVDEAQNLGKMDFGKFLSQQVYPKSEGQVAAASGNDSMRPILSPLVHGFYQIARDNGHFSIVPCGTGLSVFNMNWLEDSAPGPKGYSKLLGPFTDFQGWESLEQVQHYRDLVRRSLPNAEARIVFDTRVPVESIPELFARLRGRFRPIVSAIERMIMPSNDEIDWRQAIKETEDTLSSTETEYYGKGNIAFDISQMVRRVHNFESRYANYQNIRTILQGFVLQHFLHGRPLLLNREEAILVEASVGRILNFGKHAVTVLDEPFALLAAVNYFRRHDPKFHSAICTLLGSGSNASVHGHQWEKAVLPSLAHVFHDKILSYTGLVPEGTKSYDPILDGKAEIAGYDSHITLGIDVKTMSLDAFLEAHVRNGSRKDGKPVPPFYQPAETPSGPDVAFVLHLDNHGYCPVFVQLKMRHKMTKLETQIAFSTVKAGAVQGHLQEAMLQRYCTGYPKRLLGIVIAYPAELAGVEGSFPEVRRSERIRSTEGDTPQCISLRIDKNNIHDLFPQNHMQALDLLKGIKRQLDQTDMGQGSDDQKDEPVTKHRRYEDENEDSRVDSD
ncbi:hypothetical protein KI688_011946 [Linnemannia hyalina]|uniref:Crinkler effector protein N-terminal domain-containing protein n=1 Tax=Linnemannia hyalina TaxID=64524 RepID=A0A9P8BT25_9FUNG|nr:hypothetical protein KI688_011946 [Linnemannia hyalina]